VRRQPLPQRRPPSGACQRIHSGRDMYGGSPWTWTQPLWPKPPQPLCLMLATIPSPPSLDTCPDNNTMTRQVSYHPLLFSHWSSSPAPFPYHLIPARITLPWQGRCRVQPPLPLHPLSCLDCFTRVAHCGSFLSHIKLNTVSRTLPLVNFALPCMLPYTSGLDNL